MTLRLKAGDPPLSPGASRSASPDGIADTMRDGLERVIIGDPVWPRLPRTAHSPPRNVLGDAPTNAAPGSGDGDGDGDDANASPRTGEDDAVPVASKPRRIDGPGTDRDGHRLSASALAGRALVPGGAMVTPGADGHLARDGADTVHGIDGQAARPWTWPPAGRRPAASSPQGSTLSPPPRTGRPRCPSPPLTRRRRASSTAVGQRLASRGGERP